MIARNGDGPDGAVGTTEAGRVVELDGVNTWPIAENSPHPQAAVTPVDPVVTVVAPGTGAAL
jgi:hypothetical protein